MLTLDAPTTALVATDNKTARWSIHIFDKNGVGYGYYTDVIGADGWATNEAWGTGEAWADATVNEAVIMDFDGVELRRNSAESGIVAPSDLTFSMSNPTDAGTPRYDFADFKGGTVFVELFLWNPTYGEKKINGWKFNIKNCEPGYQKLKFTCEDFLQKYLKGDYPNTRLPQDIFPSSRTYENDALCVPVPFGTAYVPLRDVYIGSNVVLTASTIGAIASVAGSTCQFTDSANGFLAAGIRQGWVINVIGFVGNTANNGTFSVLSVTPGVIEVAVDAGLVTEAASESVNILHGAGYLVLGDPAFTYVISTIRSPRSIGSDEWYDFIPFISFNQYTKADAAAVNWRVFQAIIADSDSNGTADAPGFWRSSPGGPFLDPPVKFTRSDTATMTNPADVIAFVLKDMGVPAVNIDEAGTFASCHTVFDNYATPLTFIGAFWYKQDRMKVLAQLLTQCNSCLDVSETIQLRVLSKTSRAAITSADVLRSAEQGEGSFSYQPIVNEDLSDSGYIAFQETGEAQDSFQKVLVAAGAAATVISDEVVECPFVPDSQNAQRAGTLHFQRKLLKEAEAGFLSKGTQLALQTDDVIAINDPNYGGTYPALIDSMKINKDVSIQFQCSKYTTVFSDWENLSPVSVSVPIDDVTGSWTPVITGPDSPSTVLPNLLPGRLRVGIGTSYILLDPATPARISLYSLNTEVYRVGDLNGYLGVASALFGMGVGESGAGKANLIYDVTNGLRLRSGTTNVVNIDNAGNITISGGISAATISIGTTPNWFRVDASGNIWSGAAAYNITTNPFAVSNAGVLRAVSGIVGGWTLETDKLSAGTDADYIGFAPATGIQLGDSTFADAKFSVTPAGVLKSISGTIGGWALGATSLTGTGITLSSTGDAYLAIGTTPPTSPTVGTGIFINKTGMFGLAVNVEKFKVDAATGLLTATGATISGAITATSGKFGTATNYWSVGATGLTATSASTDVFINYGKTDFGDTTAGFILGYDFSASKPKFEIGNATQYLTYDGTTLTYYKGVVEETIIKMYTNVATICTSATAGDGSAASAGMVVTYEGLFGCGANQTSTIAAANANVRILATGAAFFSGTVTASAGAIGGFTLSATQLYAGAAATRIQLDTGAGIWLGATAFADAPFKVSLAGALTATNATISGMITGSYLYGSSLMTKGTYLSASCNAADATLNVGDTTDFAASGSASFIDSANDRDSFAYTGKTATTLTGCSGVLAHTVSTLNKPLVVTLVKGMYISDATNEMRFFGDIGNGTIKELASIGINDGGPYDIIGLFGACTNSEISLPTSSLVALGATSIDSIFTAYMYSRHTTVGAGIERSCLEIRTDVEIPDGETTGVSSIISGISNTVSSTWNGPANWEGTLTDVRGYDFSMSFSHRTLIEVSGYRSIFNFNAANITTFKELNLVGMIGEPTSITNRYAIYQADALATNYLAGNLSLGSNVDILTASYLGLGAAKGRIIFTDAATDTINFANCNVGIDNLLELTANHGVDIDGVLLKDGTVTGITNGIRYGTNIAPQLRRSRITIENGTDAAHIKVTMINEGNGDANAVQDNIGKDGVTTGVWSLNAGGNILTLLATGISGDGLLPICCLPFYNIAGTAMDILPAVTAGAFDFNFYNATTGAVIDLTTLVDTNPIYLSFVYLTTV